ncbi:hypothetical protein AB0A91_16340 [Streptomyces sp. NPDC042207]|uniref:hypothetical protein n=1 Tax=Streptomyces sp. NPDC042207 TaxID=3154331 RepID=UPI0033D0C16E
MRTRTATATLAAIAALAALTACSSNSSDGSDDAKPSRPATTTEAEQPATTTAPDGTAELAAAVQDYTAAYFKGDAKTAYAALSKRCAGRIDEDMYAATVEQAKADYGPDHPATDVKADVSGDLARVSYKVKGLPKFDQQAQPWTREGDAWKYDAC